MDTDATRFRVLLAEDDPVSCEFLTDALRACGAGVVACGDGDAALELARARAFDLLVLDHHLPGRNGDVVLRALRADAAAASHATPAVATSAERDSFAVALLRAGFAEVLAKPMSLERLRAVLLRQGLRATGEPTLDDDDAARTCGSAAAAARLRRLFADEELPKLQAELDRSVDPQSLRPTLHRLRASCGFCGAPRLAHAGESLHRALTTGASDAEIATALERFREALALTRAALHATLDA